MLFGPQRLDPVLRPELDRLDVGDHVASITAGWQEREGESSEMSEHLDRRVTDLALHGRLEKVFAEDRELFSAHRARQDRLRELQALYRYRLDFVLEPARELMRREGDPELLIPERESAIDAVRRLDRQHLDRVTETHRRFEDRWSPADRPAIQRQLGEIEEILGTCDAVMIAGGHVAVLLNRMRLFGLGKVLRRHRLFAWSAGAMALGTRIALFHDSPPQGEGNAEILDEGLGLFADVLPLPDARRRLRLDDPVRLSLLARRFAPDVCVPLDAGQSVLCTPDGPRPGQDALRITAGGRVEPIGEDGV
ncbi:MAG: Type 1 glutamine amidotransferase-like domain-containing protein [Acidobacteriota bacterium]